MFASIGRRLALLNAIVVVAIIALTGAATFLLLRQSLEREADSVLAERARDAATAWANLFAAPAPAADLAVAGRPDEESRESRHEDENEDEEEDHEARELLESGDTLLFAVDDQGRLLANARGIPIPGLPDAAGVRAALAGSVDSRTFRTRDEPIRVYTMPVRADGQVIGAIQAARSDREHQDELGMVGLMTLVGLGLGAVVAVPAGLFLAARAMRPIDLAFARQRAFVADASHELRTPLTLIRATTEYVQRLPEASPAIREELGAVLDEIDATGRMVDDLLVLARIDSDELPLRRQPTDLGDLVRETTAAVAPLAKATGLSLTVAAQQGLLADVDPDRIRQVGRILLDNAIAYTPQDGAVWVSVDRHASQARISVSDTGIGIAAADQERVFDRYFRADRARSRATGGTGLGLAIARALVQAHGGEIGLESEPGRGTTVWFTVPLMSKS
jgi:signal transduction histidine kinase